MGGKIGAFGLVNYKVHPNNQNYHVYSFNTAAEANSFEEELRRRSIWFERDTDNIKEGLIHLFGVKKSDYKKAIQANYAVSAKHRNPIIKNKALRVVLVTLTVSLLTLAIIGYVKNMQKLNERTEQINNE